MLWDFQIRTWNNYWWNKDKKNNHPWFETWISDFCYCSTKMTYSTSLKIFLQVKKIWQSKWQESRWRVKRKHSTPTMIEVSSSVLAKIYTTVDTLMVNLIRIVIRRRIIKRKLSLRGASKNYGNNKRFEDIFYSCGKSIVLKSSLAG